MLFFPFLCRRRFFGVAFFSCRSLTDAIVLLFFIKTSLT